MINGYNTDFKTAKDNRAWLKIDSVYAVEALKLTPISETEIMAYFLLPNFAPDSAKILPLGVLMDNNLRMVILSDLARFFTNKTRTISSKEKCCGHSGR